MCGFVAYLGLLLVLPFSIGVSDNETHSSPELVLTEPDQNEENGLIVKRIDDNLTLSCSLVDGNNTILPTDNIKFNWMLPYQETNRSRIITVEENVLKLSIESLQLSDAGQYSCVGTTDSKLKAHVYVAVRSTFDQPFCSSSMFNCEIEKTDRPGIRCIPNAYQCDGRVDCPTAKDESLETCGPNPCMEKLRCGDGRCIPKNWCCYGRKGCIPHPCCAEHMHNEFPLEKTGGVLRPNPNEQLLLQATLYKACACLLAVILMFTVLISAICRARLKRISNGRGRIEIPSPDSLNRHGMECGGMSPSLQECQYSLVCHSDNFEDRNRFPPSYSEYMAEANAQSSSDNVPNSSPSIVRNSDFNNQAASETEQNSETVNNTTPVRRPNDFGMGLIANAIFNSRYRPVPQQNVEISSMDYVTDSDSSSRSPATNSAGNALNSGTMEFNSHFYGERIGGPLDMNIFQGLSENRRMRHANALDRILDRFGLNAPYNVDIDRQYNRSAWEFQSFLTPLDSEQSPASSRFLTTFWGRLKDRFRWNQRADRSDGRITSHAFNNNFTNSNLSRCRRRPDTPDVPELTFDHNARRFASLFNNPEINFLNRNCYTSRDMHAVPHNFPPPYTQYATDPPPPYVSRENLLTSAQNSGVATGTDDNGNVLGADSEADGTVESASEPIVAFNTCDDNGNLEQTKPESLDDNCEAFNRSKRSDSIKRTEDVDGPDSVEPSTSTSPAVDSLNNEIVECVDSNSNCATDQSLSVPDVLLEKTSGPEDSKRSTDERGLIFPPHNLEFIDSDNVDQNMINV